MKMVFLIIILAVQTNTALAAKGIKTHVLEFSVTENGFEPSFAKVKPGESVILKITRKTDSTCATSVQVPAKKIKKELPLNKTVSFDLGNLEKGELRFSCGMNMVSAVVSVE